MKEKAYEELLDRLGRDGQIASTTVDAILAAADGDEALAAHLDGSAAPAPRAVAVTEAAPAPARVYLEHVRVENFRGIGPAATLQLAPGPGLTLVVGRNGSGKSSFAEGLELLLTGTNVRWQDKTRVWRGGWRNLHGEGAVRLAARFRLDGAPEPLDVRRAWAPDHALDGGAPITVSGPRSSWDELAWDKPLHQFRPLLSYSELGAMFSTRAATLYEALSTVLGLHEFDALAASLRTARLAREKSAKNEKTERAELKTLTGGSDDARAATLSALLAKRSVDLDAVEHLLLENDATREAQAELSALSSLVVPSATMIDRAFAGADAAAAAVAAHEATEADRLDALAKLLDDALRFHERHGNDETCPVCGAPGRLDAGWSLRSQAEVQELRRRSADLTAARRAEVAAREALRRLFAPGTPAALRGGDAVGVDTRTALAAWDAWSTAERHEIELAQTLRAALEDVGARAQAEEQRRDARWRPISATAVGWLATARRATRDRQLVATLKSAEAWMSECTAALRRERLAPIVDAAQKNWRQLRHESSVTLGDVELRKEGQQRYAAFDVTVDGAQASAFGVMSQGELSALAVSVFLPRAALPASPFGFMIIDDPVQSMDPAKVDGLARVLADAAQARQVVVFTHDERLPDAVRRLSIEARIIVVKRRARSKIELVAGRPPSDRYIGEALALAKTDDLTDEVRMRVIPGFCRSAVEAACASRVRKAQIEAGIPHADVEQQIAKLTTLHTHLAAAFGLAISQGNEINDRLRALDGESAVRAIKAMRGGAHALVGHDPLALIESTKRIVRAVEPR